MSMGEINQVKMWADQASRTYTELHNQLDALHLEHAQLLRERNELVAERDAARREVLLWVKERCSWVELEKEIKQRGWDYLTETSK
jgi:uncharacterized coiled-coil DUF342 family protein